MPANILDLHTHSDLSKHAFSSVTENIDEALKRGLKYLGVSEHQADAVNVGSHYFVSANYKVIPDRVGPLRILKGLELNILEGGTFDLDKINVANLDYAIASMHRFIYEQTHTTEENTQAYITVCQKPFVKILGHIDRDGFPCDYKQVIKAAKDNGVLIELNNSSLKHHHDTVYDRDIEILKLCEKYQCPIIINSDAHIRYDVGNYLDAMEIIDDIKFPYDLILNFNEELFKYNFPMA